MTKKSKIYTKTGDKGLTSLIGNSRVLKFDERIEAYGTLDELNSYLGLVHDLLDNPEIKEEILTIINYIFVAESHVASESESFLKMMPAFENQWITLLEKRIDTIDSELPVLKSFILPTGHPTASHIHIARTICRRSERTLIKCSQNFYIGDNIIKFINRLSDYLFVLARFVVYQHGSEEILWNPNRK